MSEPVVLHPRGREFDRFLYAPVGEDHNGYVVTVLSTLARLGFDPWREAAELSALGREAARTRLGKLLCAFRDVPALGQDHRAVAQALALLLPERPTLRSRTDTTSETHGGPKDWIRALVVIAMVLLVLAQVLFNSASWPGK